MGRSGKAGWIYGGWQAHKQRFFLSPCPVGLSHGVPGRRGAHQACIGVYGRCGWYARVCWACGVRGYGKDRRAYALRPLFIPAAIYSRGTCRPTTIDVPMFHFQVRDGAGWGHRAVTTGLQPCALRAVCCGRHSAGLGPFARGSFALGMCAVSLARGDRHPRGFQGMFSKQGETP